MELTMFEKILQLPIFQGLTKKEIEDIMSRIRLDFVNYQAGDEIVMQDDPCRGLIYIINGEIATEYRDPQGRFTLIEQLSPIGVIEPYNMFGMFQKYSRTYFFKTDGCTLTIDKSIVLKHLMTNHIIKINLLNIICNRYQQTQKLLCEFPDDNIRSKLVKFILSHSSIGKGQKEIHIKMTDIAAIIHETRLNVSKILNTLQQQGLVSLQRNMLLIKNIKDLY